MSDVLYSRNNDGTINTWEPEIDDDGRAYRFRHGRQGGAIVTTEWTEPKAKGKNTVEEQVRAEVRSHIARKIKDGYTDDITKVDEKRFFEPMLAKPYEAKRVDLAAEDWYSQPKLDGVRCIARSTGLWTRTGEPIVTCPHIVQDLAPIFAEHPDLVLDGELYSDNLAADFNTLISLVKKSKPKSEDLEATKARIEYHVYDCFDPHRPTLDFFNRAAKFYNLIQSLPPNSIMFVSTLKVRNQSHMDELFQQYLANGQEGQMLRRGSSRYQHLRTFDLLKRKEFQDDEFEVVDILEGRGNRSGMAGAVTILMKNGTTCEATPKGTDAVRIDMLSRRQLLIGKRATVQFFGVTPDGKLRFPVLKVIHE